ncbi:unnamed protein product [Protopolystoma xenopodis]|uniref:Ig-like domain-containing protein n=1 Tax=Protopolystoma xenopodis TaxID=117903 RepID=A0A3S5A0N0_9PLAT|nr:unnamed protein product [Protopolystoma xenopodis]
MKEENPLNPTVLRMLSEYIKADNVFPQSLTQLFLDPGPTRLIRHPPAQLVVSLHSSFRLACTVELDKAAVALTTREDFISSLHSSHHYPSNTTSLPVAGYKASEATLEGNSIPRIVWTHARSRVISRTTAHFHPSPAAAAETEILDHDGIQPLDGLRVVDKERTPVTAEASVRHDGFQPENRIKFGRLMVRDVLGSSSHLSSTGLTQGLREHHQRLKILEDTRVWRNTGRMQQAHSQKHIRSANRVESFSTRMRQFRRLRSELTITRISEAEVGLYSCLLESTGGNVSHSTKVSVKLSLI